VGLLLQTLFITGNMKINLEQACSIKDLCFHAKINGKRIGDIYREVDGFYYFEPLPEIGGCFSEELLGALLFELQQLNAPWKESVRKYFENEGK
jgi:hypothetical protein